MTQTPVPQVHVTLSDDARLAASRYVDALIAAAGGDELTLRAREEVRSYAAEFTQRFLRDNPQHFDLGARMDAIDARKRGAP